MLPISDSPPASQGLVAAAAAEALCQEDTTTLPPALSALLEPAKNAAALGLYGAVIDSSGTFLAHGSCPAFVGRSLEAVMAEVGMEPGDATSLFEKFAAAARRPSGSWVRYEWRSRENEPIHVKGAHASAVQLDGNAGLGADTGIVLICYGAVGSAPPAGQLPRLPPVAPSRRGVKAAARTLRRQLAAAESTTPAMPAAKLEEIINDRSGVMAAAAAEALAWEVTPIPSERLRHLLGGRRPRELQR